ncbi:Uncharacterised protein [Mycobacteroides abscessus subsp. abscessus]|nr:Uncharacterised protein [Mycobacteroides abscessus subsp. abscessus]
MKRASWTPRCSGMICTLRLSRSLTLKHVSTKDFGEYEREYGFWAKKYPGPYSARGWGYWGGLVRRAKRITGVWEKLASTLIGFVERFGTVEDSAAWPELRSVDACATVTCEDVVVPVARARTAALSPAGFINGMPVGAIQGADSCPSTIVWHKVPHVGVGELVTRGSRHVLVLRRRSDNNGTPDRVRMVRGLFGRSTSAPSAHRRGIGICARSAIFALPITARAT